MKSVIIGAGTYGEVYLAYLQEAGVEIVGFLDDDPKLVGTNVRGVPVLGDVGLMKTIRQSHGVEAVYCPLGNNKLRVKFLENARALGFKTPNYIHPSVKIAPKVSIANEGVYILQGTELMPFVTLEKDVMISTGANIVHHSYLSQGTFVSNGVNLGANVHSEKFAYCGMGCTIMTGVHTLGEDCLIGAGAVVIRDVEPEAVMAGVPAKVIKYRHADNNL